MQQDRAKAGDQVLLAPLVRPLGRTRAGLRPVGKLTAGEVVLPEQASRRAHQVKGQRAVDGPFMARRAPAVSSLVAG